MKNSNRTTHKSSGKRLCRGNTSPFEKLNVINTAGKRHGKPRAQFRFFFSVSAFPKWDDATRRDAAKSHKNAKCKCKKVQHTFVLRQSCQRHQLWKRRLSLPLSTLAVAIFYLHCGCTYEGEEGGELMHSACQHMQRVNKLHRAFG